MTLLIWRILCLVSAGLFVAGVIALLATRPLANKFYHEFHEDELLKTVKASNSTNSIYLVKGEPARFIKRYVVCKTAYEKFLICNFARPFKEISFFVVQYNRRRCSVRVLKVTQRNTGDSSLVIALSKRCRYVNILIGSADGREINFDAIRPLAMSRVRLHAAVKGFMLFLALFVMRHVIVGLFGGNLIERYLASFFNYATIAGSFLLSLLYYWIDVVCFHRRNIKKLNGGAIEYEFV